MSGLYVKLDAEYASDDKLIESGPLAELLYVRALCFCKRTLSDGKIKKSQLAAVALGIPSPAKHAQALVNVGAWRATHGGWVITAWLKRNKSADQIKTDIEARRLKSLHGNHQRWHVQEGKHDPTCELCTPPKSDPPSDPPGDPQLFAGESTEPEPEPEPEEKPKPEPKAEPEPEPKKSSSVLTVVPPTDRDDDDDDPFENVVGQIVDAKLVNHRDKPRSYRHKTRLNTILEDGDVIRKMLAERCPDDQIALFVLGYGIGAEKERTETAWCTTDCPECEGDGWIRTDNGLAPCPGRPA